MAFYNMGADRLASSIDGLGTELATTDTVTTNAYTLTFDVAWINRACDDITVSPGGALINEAGVDVTWDAGAIVTNNGTVEIRGTAGSPVTWTNIAYLRNNDVRALIYVDYLIEVTPSSYGLYMVKGDAHFFNSTLISGDATWGVIIGASSCMNYFENCTFTSVATNGATYLAAVGEIVLNTFVDCTMTNTHANNWWGTTTSAASKAIINIIGTTNFEGAECTDANANYVSKPQVYYYSRMKVTVDDGTDPLENATAPMYHKVAKGHIIFSMASIRPPNFYGGRYKEMDTDASGVVRCFALSKIYLGDINTWVYISDQNQAEAGDNAPYLVNAMYPNYQSPNVNTEAWAIETANGNLDETDVGILSCSALVAPVINSVMITDTTIADRDVSTVKVVTDETALYVTMLVNGNNIPLFLVETTATTKRWERIFTGYMAGVAVGSTVNLYAGHNSGLSRDTSLTLTVSDSGYIKPMEWTKNYLKANWNIVTVPMPNIVVVTEKKRIDRVNEDWIIIKQKSRKRKTRGRSQYKDIFYPVILEIGTTYHEDRKDLLLQEVRRIIEADWNFLPSNENFDYVNWTSDGEDVSMGSARAWKMIYEFELVKIFRKLP